MDLDIRALRANTPGCAGGVIHLNNAGASLMPSPVLDALKGHIDLESRIGGYEAAVEAADAIERFYVDVAALIGGHPDEIAFLDSATRAWLAVFHAMDWRPGDEVLTARSEYNANMVSFLHARERQGIVHRLVPDAEDGTIDTDALEAMIGPRTRLICLSHMPTNDGLINPAQKVGQIAAARTIPFLLDACQSAGQMPLDVAELGCTMLSATGRKYMRGPRGTGFLWVRRDWLDRLMPHALDIRSASWTGVDAYEIASDARRFELWEAGIAGQIALGSAARYAREVGIAPMWDRIQTLAGDLRGMLSGIGGVTVHDQGSDKSGIVTFSHARLNAPEIVARLRSVHSINTSVSACQLTRSSLIAGGTTHMVRASVHAYNTTQELDALAEALDAMTGTRGAGLSHANKNDNSSPRQPSLGVEQ
ncbi:aminotransferase class V-fold PLP-dependent enzyme [Pelagibacterium montanilacus]|uniref:aminotransferase class V-fold PLP-dependent enzyme n=1 Tax=Pelagibacterium montanilacus TaxID=2185280 RepID=UPI000F8E1313|nr:aminotransferase class V-fold PLP-dependent enzyme [Pelagibacterium montanilacus]